MTEFAHAARRTPHTPQRHVPGALALGDFTADRRMVMLVAMAVVVGAAGAAGAWVLLRADRAGHQPGLVRPDSD